MSVGLSILIVGGAAAAGWGAGWWLRHDGPVEQSANSLAELEQLRECHARTEDELRRAQSEMTRLKNEAAQVASKASQQRIVLDVARRDAARSRDVINQLQLLAHHLAEDVGEHNTRVQAINLELGEGNKETHDVLTAVAKLLDANVHLQEQLETAESKLQRQSRELQTHIAEARTDVLTGLANRRAFDELLVQLERANQQQSQVSCVMMVDVDNFKAFNDSHGHHAGDEVLRRVARVLEEQLGATAIVFRHGGEEFAVLFPHLEFNAARMQAERARLAIAAARVPWQGHQLQVTACAGIAQLESGEPAAQAVARADAALYASKSQGRNRGCWHDGQLIHSLTTTEIAAGPLPPHRDPLTGLPTQGALREELIRRMAECTRTERPLSGLLLDVDRFQELIAQHGESAGETMLRATAQFLRAALREMDFVARYDRQQFAMLLPGTSPADAAGVAERLRAAIEKCKLPANDGLLTFTVSIGVASRQTEDAPETFIARLQQSVSAARATGGNCQRSSQHAADLIARR